MVTITAPAAGADPTLTWARQATYAANQLYRRLASRQLGRIVAHAQEITDLTGITTTLTTVGTMTVSQVNAKIYCVQAWAHSAANADASGRVELQLIKGTVSGGVMTGTLLTAARRTARTSNQSRPNTVLLTAFVTAVADGDQTYTVAMVRHSGTATWSRRAGTTYPQHMIARMVA